jgi:LPS-assembly protein
MRRFLSAVGCASVLWLAPAGARAQQPQQPPVSDTTSSESREFTNEQKDVHFIGKVEMNRGDTTIYADDVVVFGDTNAAVATGNVVFAQGNNRLSAERAEFNTETHLGTFYNAWGIANVPPPRRPARSGGLALPTPTSQETNVYFFGEKVEKIGPRKYKITKGGFSTCVQPTPRWNLNGDTVILNVDHYTLLKQAVFSVKGVPMMYFPIFYYPTKRDNRATGFLIPTYGTSTIRGQTLSNAFFWAIDRSQDATIFHDWFSKVGQGVGSEYRYNFGTGDGNLKAYLLDQHESTSTASNGDAVPIPATRSYEVRGSANQLLPHNFRARGRVDYFSSLQTMQTFNTNIYDVSRNQRSFGGNLVGAFSTYTLNATFDHSEYFYNSTQSNVSGSWPRVALARNERPLLGSPLYFSLGSEFAHLLRESRLSDAAGNQIGTDSGLTRLDMSPQIRYPFKKWGWLTANSTAGWRETYYTRSLAPNPTDPSVPTSTVIDKPLNRQFFTLQTQLVGPVFNRIWDTPNSGYAEKFKHTIEPFLTVQKITSIDNFARIVTLDGTDSFVGGTNFNYGLNNRFFAKRKLTPGSLSQAREFVSVEINQTYYTDQRAAQYDRQYATSASGGPPSHFSALSLAVRATPANDVNASVRAEFDPKYRQLRTISAQGTYGWRNEIQTTVGWSKKAFIEGLSGFNNPAQLDHYINVSANVHTKDNRFGGLYSFNYDVLRTFMQNQRLTGFYNAQCCGLALEYQAYNFPPGSAYTTVGSDHRFFMSFTLAGLGNFSPFNGALGGVPR